ncbi:glycosyl hydrolase 115 family protein [Niveispirillum lacus]|nr:glycosyl hydrolase 115 family protein [Niveispirillum lacus]
MRSLALVLLLLLPLLCTSPCSALASVGPADWIMDKPAPGAFPVAVRGRLATIRHDAHDHPVVAIAAADLAGDLAQVTGGKAEPVTGGAYQRTEIWVGTLGRSSLIDGLVATGKVDVTELRGAWESYIIIGVPDPVPGVEQALVIIGSDRRGTAYGAYELSRATGVSPWIWWADVPPPYRPSLYVEAGTRRFGPPSVKYRGIFINDEDWGLHPWAANHFDPARGDIGPKTYEKVFGLLLRLRANLLWPAMHEVTQPFNADPANAQLADRYAIIMGSSHAEPMLRNNVGEWKDTPTAFNYATHAGPVRSYWRDRVVTNGQYENIYTLGMRGIHDSGMVGAEDLPARRALLNRIIADQRQLLSDHVSPALDRIPQVFTPYKEVLEIYRAGLDLPDDVTLVWPDDNFGYIRQFPGPRERARSGGSGVYYHLSYLGAPLSYLWLSTVPPSLIALEMGRAYDLGADRVWVANVGDIKPAETNIELFLTMGWDMPGFRATGGTTGFLTAWAGREFGRDIAPAVTDLLQHHHQLNFERKPEHLQWWLPGQKYRRSDLGIEAAQARLGRFADLERDLDTIHRQIPAKAQDAFFQLVAYPVRAASLANQRFFHAEAYERLFNADPYTARQRGQAAHKADQSLHALTRRYNEEVAGGKWRGMMAMEPADGQWRSYRLTPPVLPATGLTLPSNAPPPLHPRKPVADNAVISIEAESVATHDSAWTLIPGLGRGEGSMAAGPVTAVASSTEGPALTYTLNLPPGDWDLSLDLIPTFPVTPSGKQQLAVLVTGMSPVTLSLTRDVGDSTWAEGVLDGRIRQETGITLLGGRTHQLRLEMRDPGPVLDALVLRRRNQS